MVPMHCANPSFFLVLSEEVELHSRGIRSKETCSLETCSLATFWMDLNLQTALFPLEGRHFNLETHKLITHQWTILLVSPRCLFPALILLDASSCGHTRVKRRALVNTALHWKRDGTTSSPKNTLPPLRQHLSATFPPFLGRGSPVKHMENLTSPMPSGA